MSIVAPLKFARWACLCGVVTASAGAVQAEAKPSVSALANTLLSLTNQATASVCMIDAGVAVNVETRELAQTRQSIVSTLATLQDFDALENDWLPMDVGISMILAGDNPADYVPVIDAAQAALQVTVMNLRDQAAYDEGVTRSMSVSDMLALDILHRLDVLMHQMKAEACALSKDVGNAELRRDLTNKIGVYEASLMALTNGVPDLGIAAPVDDSERQMLAASGSDWQNMRPVLEHIADTGDATSSELIGLRTRISLLDDRMAALVDLYAIPADAHAQAALTKLDVASN